MARRRGPRIKLSGKPPVESFLTGKKPEKKKSFQNAAARRLQKGL